MSDAEWPPAGSAYRRQEIPERLLQFGTGMLLRALCAATVDAANRAGRRAGRIVVVQSTPQGKSGPLNAQDGLFTLVERGRVNGKRVERTQLIGSISRALVAEHEWEAVRDVAARPETQVIVSNVTEGGFSLDAEFPTRLTDALYARFERLPDGPLLLVIPTELVPDNGPKLAAMVDELAARTVRPADFRRWLTAHVQFCSSLVDRITTGAPPLSDQAALEARLGYADQLLTVAEPYAFWAIEGDPQTLRTAFPIDAPDSIVFARDIGFYRERKLRLLNAPHTAMAPLALLAGIRTVREAMDHPRLGAFLRRILFDEIIPATDVPAEAALQFAHSVVERFRNPWLDHEWRMIATNQAAKMQIRVVPLIGAFASRRGQAPEGLALACAAHLKFLRQPVEALGEATRVPGFPQAVARWSGVLEQKGVEGALP
ncbi:MAG TPA: tagaturonate reductase [Gemmatimonadales bacterium]